jgi:hypothetical protein
VSKSSPGWTCEELNVVELLEQGEHLVYEIGKSLYYLATEAL